MCLILQLVVVEQRAVIEEGMTAGETGETVSFAAAAGVVAAAVAVVVVVAVVS